ncbi:MAG: hypothetical protein LBJ67_03745 [Planctomycetaceae bacterium]|jgi:hypothetical protein|nr:hypothetical protein [Planctomycetaceae bacterium]
MMKYFRVLAFWGVAMILLQAFQPNVFAAEKTGGEELPVPWLMGNIIVVLFAIGLVALATRSSRRDFSAIPDEFGNRPNARNLKKKKGKVKLDFSHGPIQHPDLQNALVLSIIAFFIPIIVLFAIPSAMRVRDEIKGDPRFLGGGLANFLVILNYITVAIWILSIIGGVVGILIVLSSGGSAGG